MACLYFLFILKVEWQKVDSSGTYTRLTSDNIVIFSNRRLSLVKGRFIDEDVFTLVIAGTRFSDAGVYRCATTGAKVDAMEMTLTVVEGKCETYENLCYLQLVLKVFSRYAVYFSVQISANVMQHYLGM